MGIFDDAIREHLELKRHAGVDEEELKELEDEAFGPPARPGEPDFPGSTSEEAAVESGEGAPAEAEAAPSPGVFDAETAAETPQGAVIEAPSEEEPALTPIDDATVPETEDPAPEPDDTGVGPEPLDPAEASTFTTEEREAIADQPTVFFEQQQPAELELGDLELDVDEEIEEVGGSESKPLRDEDPLIVEEAFAEPVDETEVAEPPHEVEPEPAPEPETELEPEPEFEPEGEATPPETSDFPATEVAETTEEGAGDDDVLEETPEFLRDNPDDDELWFEQGEPKDFDF